MMTNKKMTSQNHAAQYATLLRPTALIAPYGLRLTALTSLILTALLLAGCKNDYIITVWNRSEASIVIKRGLVDENVIMRSEVLLDPIGKKFVLLPEKATIASIAVSDPKQLKLLIENGSTNLQSELSCDIKDENGAGCILNVSYYGNGQLNCHCQSLYQD
ncbi:MAG: hypothetical protein HOP36_09920 [Methyloglobulus sp.]|nr:hypothetical protein [Methyloglobulus sp.]